MNIDVSKLTANQKYHLMVQSIVPRPIAWVLSRNQNQTYNLAPFSYFNGVSSDPPLVMISVGHKKSGEKKDTWKNIEREKTFVIQIPSKEHAEAVTGSAFEFSEEESEVEALGLPTKPCFKNDWPVVQTCSIAMFCRLFQLTEIGSQALILGEIQSLYVDDQIVHQEGNRTMIDAQKLQPLARLGGNQYVGLGEVFEIARPKTQPGEEQ